MGDLSENFSRREFECSCGCGMDTVDAQLLHLEMKYPDRFGLGCYDTFTHFDTRTAPPARWSG
jgi:hypothetical protein